MDIFIDLVRSFFFFLDGLIYSFIVIVYNLFVDIAQTSIFTDEIIDLFASRVYVLLGIFMLFKVSFSILTYIINPDSFLDKNKGFPKLISNILITLALLLLTPWIFSQLMDIQRIILRDNIIGKIFSTTDTNSNVIGDAGNVMAYQTYKAFFHINTDVYTSCVDLEKNYDPSNPSAFDECKTKGFNDSDNFENFAQNLRYAYETNSISIYMNSDLLNQNGSDNDYTMYYLPFISTLAGGAIALLLIVFCFDIAVRSIKLGFLRMLAPVPIVSRIDPQKGKEVFDKWLKLCISVYLDLFIRLIAIYFAIFVITQLMDFKMVDAVTGLEKDINVFVRVFIILGALLFAKQLPQLISDLTGVKMDGKFTLNPMNKIRQTPLVGAGITTAAALAGGAYTGLRAGYQAGSPLRGMWQGMMGAKRDIKGKVPLMGDEKGGKSPRAFYSGMQAGHKTITGKDFETFDPWKLFGTEKGEDKIKEYKNSKFALQAQQSELDAKLHTLYDELSHITDPGEKDKKLKEIRANREEYGKFSKYISVLDDQIRDVKKLYHIDESPREDVAEAMKAAAPYLNIENSSQPTPPPTSATPPTHGPNGRGDPVPGQPNPNTSRDKQKRRKNN